MANSLLKLTVESSEYDAKLKKAAEGVRHLADIAHKSAGDMTGLEQSTLDYIKSIGEMETKSRSAAGQVRELESTYKELKVIYDQLNEVEKADEGGKALAASLEQLKQRANDAKKSLEDASNSLQGNERAAQGDSMSINDLTSAIGINLKQFTAWGLAIAGGKVVMSTFKDLMNSSRETVDQFGRDFQALQNVYESFLISLNNGDISGFLTRIDEIVGAARSAYDALSDLQEFNAFNRVNVQKARTGLNSAITDYREGNATKQQVRDANEILKNELRERGKREQAVYEETIKQIANDYGTNADELKELLAGNYQDWSNQKHSYLEGSGTAFTFTPMASPYVWSGQQAQIGTKAVAATSQERLSELARTIPLEKLDKLQQLGEQAEATNTEITQLDKTLTRLLSKKTGGGGKTTNINTDEFTEIIGLIGNAQEHVKDLQKQISESWDAGEIASLRKELKGAQDDLDVLQGKLPKDTVADISIKVDDEEAERKLTSIQGVSIQPKVFTIDATDDSLPLLREIDGVTVAPKTFDVTATDEAMPKLSEIKGVTIDPKTLEITATGDALAKLIEIEGVQIDPKTFEVKAYSTESWAKLQEIEGFEIDPKTMTVTADTSEALLNVQEMVSDMKGTVVDINVVPVVTDEDIERSLREQYGKPIEVPVTPKASRQEVLKQDYAMTLENFGQSALSTQSVAQLVENVKSMLKQADLGSDLYNSMTEKLKDATTMSTLLQELMERGLEGADLEQVATALKEKLRSPEGIDQEAVQKWIEGLNEKIKKAGGVELALNAQTGEVEDKKKKKGDDKNSGKGKDSTVMAIEKFNGNFSQLTGGVGNIVSGVQQLGIKIPEEIQGAVSVLQGISTIITGITSILSLILVAEQASATATWVDAITPFTANGGFGKLPHAAFGRIIPGNSFSGDNIFAGGAWVNSGELVLNRAQQGVLASELQGGAMQNMRLEAVVTGEQIMLASNNRGRRTGRGEIVQSRRAR